MLLYVLQLIVLFSIANHANAQCGILDYAVGQDELTTELPEEGLGPGTVCTYTFRAQPAHAVQLTFRRFDVGVNAPVCIESHVVVMETQDGRDFPIGSYCGNLILPAITSTTEIMRLRILVGDFDGARLPEDSVAISVIEVAAPDETCGPRHVATTRNAVVMEIPANRLSIGRICTYILRAPDRDVNQLTFTRAIGFFTAQCLPPLLNVTEVDNARTFTRAEMCGALDGAALVSSTGITRVTLSATSSIGGFVRQHAVSLSHVSIARPAADACGPRVINVDAAVRFTFPTAALVQGQVCQYRLVAADNRRIQLAFAAFRVGAAVGLCSTPNLDITDTVRSVVFPLAQHCGPAVPANLISLSNNLDLVLRVGSARAAAIAAGAVVLTHSAVGAGDNGCGEQNIVLEAGVISRSSVPARALLTGFICRYSVAAPEGFNVRLIITQGAVGAQAADCQPPNLIVSGIRDGHTVQLARLCGPLANERIISESNQMQVTLRTGSVAAQIGADSATLTFEAVPGERPDVVTTTTAVATTVTTRTSRIPTVPTTTIISTDSECGPSVLYSDYDESALWKIPAQALTTEKVCEYVIIARRGEQIMLNVESFNVGKRENICKKPFVLFSKDESCVKTKFKEMCGQGEAFTVTADGKRLYVTLNGDSTVKQYAIEAKYKSSAIPNTLQVKLLTALLAFVCLKTC